MIHASSDRDHYRHIQFCLWISCHGDGTLAFLADRVVIIIQSQKSCHQDLLKPCEQKVILSSRGQQDRDTETALYSPQLWWQVGLAVGVTVSS